MRRSTITLSAALMLLVLTPASALARHHHRRHHSRVHHARIERFGRDLGSTPTTTSSADNAGTVQSFSGGDLTIMLADGSTVSGMVTNDTELECTATEPSQTMHADGDSGSGDQSSGSGDQSSGSGDQSSGDQSSGDQSSGDQSSADQSSGEDQGDTAEQNENQADDQNENQAEDQNENQTEDQTEDQGDNQAQNGCSTADLTPGTVVREAELRISSAGSVWEKVELGS